MAKIISFDLSRRRPRKNYAATSCDHKYVVAYNISRKVHCAICGSELDPFDVMLELLKGYIPPSDNNRELRLFSREMERRSQEKRPKRR